MQPKGSHRSARLHAQFQSCSRLDPYNDHQLSSSSSHKFVAEWLESLPKELSYNEPHLPPEMDKTDDTSASASITPYTIIPTISATRSSCGTLVAQPLYRSINLALNHITLLYPNASLPEYISLLVDGMSSGRDSVCPSLGQLRHDTDLQELAMGTPESAVEQYFRNHIFTVQSNDCIARVDKLPMRRDQIPDAGHLTKVSGPVPDVLYGYRRQVAFPQHQIQLAALGTEMVANTQDLICPFFVVQFKADGPSGDGSLWAATNQCLGGTATCLNIIDRLNRRMGQGDEMDPALGAVFSIAMNGTEARIFVSWKPDQLSFHTRQIESFLVQKPDQLIEFRNYVQNIIDWGKTRRLNGICEALDRLFGRPRLLSGHQLAGSDRKGSRKNMSTTR